MNQMMENFWKAKLGFCKKRRIYFLHELYSFWIEFCLLSVNNFLKETNLQFNFRLFQVVVHRNNIYYANSVSEWPSNVKQLTRNGQEGVVFNGIPDWLYSDKIFGQSDRSQQSAIWFSPEGTKLSFASFDDSKVSPISYPKYGSYDDPSNVYPSLVTLRYPLAGRDNPTVTVFVADIASSSPEPRKVTPPSDVGR